MASPQLENGYVPISQELLQAITRTKLKPTTRATLDCILSMTYGWQRKSAPIALSFFVNWTGYSKAAVRRALEELFDRKMLRISKGRPLIYTIQKDHDEWLSNKEYKAQRKAPKAGLNDIVSAQRGSTSESAQFKSQNVPSAQRGSTSEVLNGGALKVLNGGAPKVLNGGAPSIIHRIQNTSPSTEIISNASEVNGKGHETWLTDYNEIWKGKFGGNLPFGPAAKYLREAEKELGRELALQNFRAFCEAHDVQFIGKPAAALSKFAATCGAWTKRKKPSPDAIRLAKLQEASQAV
jgi:phage replication O-like protein O